MLQMKVNHAAGFSEDCAALLAEFSANRSPEFRHFCDAWKHCRFPYIFYGYRSDELLVQFIEDALNIVKHLFVKSQLHLDRIGSIYLLYTLYFKQPTKQFCKLRFTMEETTELLEFYESLDQGYDQVRLIFWKLVQADAFRFVECEHEYGFERFLDRKGMKEVSANATTARIGTAVTREINTLKADQIPALQILEASYNEMKRHLDTSASRNLLPTTTIMGEIDKGFRNIEKHFEMRSKLELQTKMKRRNRQKKLLKTRLGDDDESSDNEDAVEGSDEESADGLTIGDRRAMLKRSVHVGNQLGTRREPKRRHEKAVEEEQQVDAMGVDVVKQKSVATVEAESADVSYREVRSKREFLCLKLNDHFAGTKMADKQEDMESADSEPEDVPVAGCSKDCDESLDPVTEGTSDSDSDHRNIEDLLV